MFISGMDCRGFIKYVEEQVPARLKTNKFLVFQELIRKRNITSEEELAQFLARREEALSDYMRANKTGGTMEVHLRGKAEELAFIKFVKLNFMKYL